MYFFLYIFIKHYKLKKGHKILELYILQTSVTNCAGLMEQIVTNCEGDQKKTVFSRTHFLFED